MVFIINLNIMDNQNNCGIYKIINKINNKFYIGSSYDIKMRIRKHFEKLKRNKHHSVYFQNAYNKYGKENFYYEILEICNREDTLKIEQKYLDSIINWKQSYNMSKKATGNCSDLSTHPNREQILKNISNASKGKHTKPFYINDVRYEKLQDVANIYGVDVKAISSKLKNWKNKNYYYAESPKYGEYDINKHKKYFYHPINKVKYYCKCGCGTEISKDSKFCKNCRKIRKDNRKYIRPVMVNGKEFSSVREALIYNKIEYGTLYGRIKSNTMIHKDYYFLDNPKDVNKLLTIEDINKKINETKKINGSSIGSNHKPFKINNVQYVSLSKASKDLKISKTTIFNRLISIKYDNYRYV
jgi:group I intron endonuclease